MQVGSCCENANSGLTMRDCLQLLLNKRPILTPLLQIAYINRENFGVEEFYYTDTNNVVRLRQMKDCTFKDVANSFIFHSLSEDEKRIYSLKIRNAHINEAEIITIPERKICYLLKSDQSRKPLQQHQLTQLLFPSVTLVAVDILAFQQYAKSKVGSDYCVFSQATENARGEYGISVGLCKYSAPMQSLFPITDENLPGYIKSATEAQIQQINEALAGSCIFSATFLYLLDLDEKLLLLDIINCSTRTRDFPESPVIFHNEYIFAGRKARDPETSLKRERKPFTSLIKSARPKSSGTYRRRGMNKSEKMGIVANINVQEPMKGNQWSMRKRAEALRPSSSFARFRKAGTEKALLKPNIHSSLDYLVIKNGVLNTSSIQGNAVQRSCIQAERVGSSSPDKRKRATMPPRKMSFQGRPVRITRSNTAGHKLVINMPNMKNGAKGASSQHKAFVNYSLANFEYKEERKNISFYGGGESASTQSLLQKAHMESPEVKPYCYGDTITPEKSNKESKGVSIGLQADRPSTGAAPAPERKNLVQVMKLQNMMEGFAFDQAKGELGRSKSSIMQRNKKMIQQMQESKVGVAGISDYALAFQLSKLIRGSSGSAALFQKLQSSMSLQGKSIFGVDQNMAKRKNIQPRLARTAKQTARKPAQTEI